VVIETVAGSIVVDDAQLHSMDSLPGLILSTGEAPGSKPCGEQPG